MFLRQRGRFYQWLPERKLVAGRWSLNDISASDSGKMFTSLSPFLEWWAMYEQWILDYHGEHYREQCFREWSKVNSKLTWLPPQAATQWVQSFLEQRDQHVRPKHFN